MKSLLQRYEVTPPPSEHLAPSEHLGLFWREKNIKCFFPATTEQNITGVNFLCKPSKSLILMAINVLVAIPSEHLLCRAKF